MFAREASGPISTIATLRSTDGLRAAMTIATRAPIECPTTCTGGPSASIALTVSATNLSTPYPVAGFGLWPWPRWSSAT